MLELRLEPREGAARPVLGELHIRVERGDRICLLGPSGIGKTTLLNWIAGLEVPGAARRARAPHHPRLGYLFQEHRLLPWRTVRQNLRLTGCSAEDAERLLAQVGLAGCGDRWPDQLSLGMARRVALARCLAVRPELLLLDEPFASLDLERADRLRQLIGAVLDERPAMAMICVTHDPGDVGRLANRFWYLDGRPARLQHDERLDTPAQAERLLQRLPWPPALDLARE